MFDQRGSLRSPAPDSLITFRNFVNDIELLRTAFGLSKANILAHSNGTSLALDYLYHHAEAVNKLVLIGSPLSLIDGKYFENLDAPIQKYTAAIELWQSEVNQKIESKKKTYNLTDGVTLSSIQNTLEQKILYAANHTYLMRDIEKTQNAFFNPDVFEALKQNTSNEEWAKRTSHLSEALTKNSIPISVINGEHDYVDPSANVWPEIANQYKHINYIEIKDAGHNIWLDQPKTFKKALKRVLD